MNVADIGHIAGLFEGEGTPLILKSAYTPRVTIANSDIEVLEWIKATVGYGSIADKDKKRNPDNCYCWFTSKTSNVLDFIELIAPYLISERKISGCEALKDFCLMRLENLHKNRSVNYYIKAEWYYQTVNSFNLKGKGTGGG